MTGNKEIPMKRNEQPKQILHPFLHARSSKALRDEDQFMRDHGRAGNVAIFMTVTFLGRLASFFVLALRKLLGNIHKASHVPRNLDTVPKKI